MILGYTRILYTDVGLGENFSQKTEPTDQTEQLLVNSVGFGLWSGWFSFLKKWQFGSVSVLRKIKPRQT